MEPLTGPERLDKSYGDIPGSKPNWVAANIKTKGKAAVQGIPPARLGETGWAAWMSSHDPKLGFGRRHYHESPSTQTVARASLPCVDPTAAAAASSINWQLSHSLAVAYQRQRRHRRMVATPPCKERPLGKRMVTKPSSERHDLLQDPEPSAINSGTNSVTLASSVPTACRCNRAKECVVAGQQQQQHQQQEMFQMKSACSSITFSRCSSSNSKPMVGDYSSPTTDASSNKSTCAAATVAVQAVPAAGDLNSGRTGVPPRVQDNPDYFRTPKDPPAFRRFCETVLSHNRANPGQPSAAARHKLGSQQRWRAAEEQAKKEVAALQSLD